MLIIIRRQGFFPIRFPFHDPRKLTQLLTPLYDYPGVVLANLILVFFLLFMFYGRHAVLVMTVPILLPVMKAMNIDVLWFGVFVGALGTIGLMTRL
jgi:TRAP-type C4-dicarboxylate transport system permease large subunit